MATNSTNTTATVMVGWQAAPDTRGTLSIIWNCICVILLITWTSFRPSVGISPKQRLFTTTTAILVPQLPALVALGDFILAYRLWRFLKSNVDSTWGEGWTLTKSFLVVKGGICSWPRHRNRPDVRPNYRQCNNTATDGIIDPRTFLWLAYVGDIRYQDLPTTQEIHDKSKADWFGKAIALLQLFWAVINVYCRNSNNYTVSVLESMTLEWIVFGVLASILWWKCPKDIKIPYYVPLHDYRRFDYCQLTGTSHSDHDLRLSTQSLLDKVVESEDRYRLTFGFIFTLLIMVFAVFYVPVKHEDLFIHAYQWNPVHAGGAWAGFTCFYILSAALFVFCDLQFRYWQCTGDMLRRYVEPETHDSPSTFYKDHAGCFRGFLSVAKWIGIYSVVELNYLSRSAPYNATHMLLGPVVVVVLIALSCQIGRIITALTAFSSAPRDIYDVPKAWILEAIIHVGG